MLTSVVTREPPSAFFKFRNLEGGNAEFLRRTLINSELYFATPDSFNDPFDCSPVLKMPQMSDLELIESYMETLRQHRTELTEDQRRSQALAEVYCDSGPRAPGFVERMQRSYWQMVPAEIGVFCLSAIPTDILMWSHYAHLHQGVCLHFDADYMFSAGVLPVTYQEERPGITLFKNEKDMVEAALLTKAAGWTYEQEWRVIHYRQGAGVCEFPPEALVGVVLGARISRKNEGMVVQWVRARKTKTKITRARLSKTKYMVEIY